MCRLAVLNLIAIVIDRSKALLLVRYSTEMFVASCKTIVKYNVFSALVLVFMLFWVISVKIFIVPCMMYIV